MQIMKKKSKAVRMTDVALRAGVSQATVSRVINGSSNINSKTRERVLDILRQTGYKSDIFNLLKNDVSCPRQISLLMCPLPEQTDPFALEYYALQAAGVREVIEKRGGNLQMHTLKPDASGLPSQLNADGIILLGNPSWTLRQNLRERKIPYLVVASEIVGLSSEDIVTCNNYDSMFETCCYLARAGYRRIGMLISRHNFIRRSGVIAWHEQEQREVRPDDFRLAGNTETSSFIKVIYQWLASKDLPDAVIVSSYDVADVFETILRQQGIRVPEDIFLICFDHRPVNRLTRTCILTDPAEMGGRAALRLQEKIQNSDFQPVQILVPMRIYEKPESVKEIEKKAR